MTAPAKLRFGIMCYGDQLRNWEFDCIRKILATGHAELALLIVDAAPPKPSSLRQKLKRALMLKGILWSLHQRLFPWHKMPAISPVDGGALLAGVPRLPCATIRKGKFSRYFNAADCAAIREHNLDFVLRFAFGIIRGEVLSTARYGVWSFHHDDETRYRGSPPAFWEVSSGDPVSGAMLQRLTDRLDAGVVLQRMHIRTHRYSFLRNLDGVLQAAAGMPARVVWDIVHGCAGYLEAPPSQTTAPIYVAPNNRQVLIYLARCCARWIRDQVRGTLTTESWNVGIVRAPIHAFLDPDRVPPVEWLPYRRPYRFIADPFALEAGPGHLLLLMEEFDDRDERGRIVMARWSGEGPLKLETLLEDGPHASYPFVFSHQGRVFSIPETSRQREVRLYELDPLSGRLTDVACLLRDFPALDPTVFPYQGRWWMFCSHREELPNAALYLWHAPSLLGPWEPHPANPVKVDVRASRPGGTPFVHEGVLYRPTQDCSRCYGGGISINRVLSLTPSEFREETVVRFGPLGREYPEGAHTLSAAGACTVVDGKRLAFAPRLLGARLRYKLSRLLPRSNSVV